MLAYIPAPIRMRRMPRSKTNVTNPSLHPLDTFLRHVAQVFGQHLSEVIGRAQGTPRALTAIPNAQVAAKQKRISRFAGVKVNMDCRVADCLDISGGPRWGYMCKKHRKLSKKAQQAARAAWNASAHATQAVAPIGAKNAGSAKNSASLGENTAVLLAHIKTNAGQRLEQIAAAMKVATSAIKASAAQLRAEKRVTTKGEKRGTKYFAA